jgi:hypothetical protein
MIYSDITINHWAFTEVTEASIEHKYEIRNDGFEIWTEFDKSILKYSHHYDILQNMSFIPTHCFIIVPVHVIINIATIVTSSL